MKNIANLFGLLIVGLIILGLARRPAIINDFFNGIRGTLGLLVQK
jgi:hypothetical protein